MTKKEMFMAIREVVIENEDMVAFIDKEIELLNRKSSRPRKMTATQIENEAFKAQIIDYLTEVDTSKCIADLQKEIPALAPLKCQRITHLLTALINAGKLEKTYVKKTPYYSVV